MSKKRKILITSLACTTVVAVIATSTVLAVSKSHNANSGFFHKDDNLSSNNYKNVNLTYVSEGEIEDSFKHYIWFEEKNQIISTIIRTVEEQNPGFVSINFDVLIKKIDNKKSLVTGLNFYNANRSKEVLFTSENIKEMFDLEFVFEQVEGIDTKTISYTSEADIENNFKHYAYIEEIDSGWMKNLLRKIEKENSGFVVKNFDLLTKKINSKKYLVTGFNFYNEGRKREILFSYEDIKNLLNWEFVMEQE